MRESKKSEGGAFKAPPPGSYRVNGKNNNSDIAYAFSDHYNDLYNCVNYNIKDMDNLYENVCKDSLYCLDHKHAITLSDIDNAMKKMKRGKGDGYDGLTPDYLINGTLFYYISVLFSCMLTHCCIPESFSMSTMVPIPKLGAGYCLDWYGIIVRTQLTIRLLHGAKSCVDYGSYRT